MTDQVLDEIVMAAVDVTAATVGWLLAVDGDDLVVVAAAGGEAPGDRVGRRVEVSGAAGLAVASGQAAALDSPPDDESNVGAGGLDGNPAGVLAAPCGHDDVIGVLEVARPEGSGPFTVDDIDEVTLLARVAGAALEARDDAASVATPQELAAELAALASADPRRYAAVARMLDAVLGQG